MRSLLYCGKLVLLTEKCLLLLTINNDIVTYAQLQVRGMVNAAELERGVQSLHIGTDGRQV